MLRQTGLIFTLQQGLNMTSQIRTVDYYRSLLPYCKTQNQITIVNHIIEAGGSVTKAARDNNVATSNYSTVTGRIAKYMAMHTYISNNGTTQALPQGQVLKGTSTLYKDDKGVLTWVKTNVSAQDQLDALRDMAASIIAELPSVAPIAFAHSEFDTDIIPFFQLGDAHLGMLAHHFEVGEDYDLQIAEQELMIAITKLVERSPVCERCVINDLGDFTHYENMAGVTEASGHTLDFDTRYPKMIRVYARLMRAIIETAAAKFRYVDVIINQGNHSRTNDIFMAEMLRQIYSNNPRIHILDNASVFIPYRMGNTFVLLHHGDKSKMPILSQVMATDFRHDFGEAHYKYIDTGHIHNNKVLAETYGVVVESFNQIASTDKYAHDGGWRSRKCLTVIFRSRTYGETGRITISREEVKDILDNVQSGTNARNRRSVYTV